MFSYFGFLVFGSMLTYLLAGISEYLEVTRLNFIPLGGPSWALWLYPVYFLISFCIVAAIFRLPKAAYFGIIVAFVILFLLLIYLSQGQIFSNWKPFGIDAY